MHVNQTASRSALVSRMRIVGVESDGPPPRRRRARTGSQGQRQHDDRRPAAADANLLTTAPATRRRSIPPRRALARVVELLSPGGLERLVGEAHHGIGQPRPPVLRDGGAALAPSERNARRDGSTIRSSKRTSEDEPCVVRPERRSQVKGATGRERRVNHPDDSRTGEPRGEEPPHRHSCCAIMPFSTASCLARKIGTLAERGRGRDRREGRAAPPLAYHRMGRRSARARNRSRWSASRLRSSRRPLRSRRRGFPLRQSRPGRSPRQRGRQRRRRAAAAEGGAAQLLERASGGGAEGWPGQLNKSQGSASNGDPRSVTSSARGSKARRTGQQSAGQDSPGNAGRSPPSTDGCSGVGRDARNAPSSSARRCRTPHEAICTWDRYDRP